MCWRHMRFGTAIAAKGLNHPLTWVWRGWTRPALEPEGVGHLKGDIWKTKGWIWDLIKRELTPEQVLDAWNPPPCQPPLF